MKIFGRTLLSVFILFALCLSSCIKEDDFNFDKIAHNALTPEYAVPLIHSELSIGDITGAGSDMLSVNPDQTVNLVYNSNIYSKRGYEFFPPFNQTSAQTLLLNYSDSSTIYSSGSLTKVAPFTVTMSFPNNEQIDSMTIRRGDLRINITNDIPHDGILNVSIPEAKLNGMPYSKNIPFSAYTSQSIYVQDISDMTGYNMKTNIAGVPNRMDVVYTITFNNSNSALECLSKNFDIATSFDMVSPASAFGYFGQNEFIMPLDSSNLGVFNNINSGTIFFDNPKMTISLKNSFGMPLDATIGPLSAVLGNGTQIPFTGAMPTPLIDYPLMFGQEATRTMVFDKNNSNIQTIINSAPKYLIYGLDAGINSPLPTYNFMGDSSEFRADIKIEIPLTGYAAGFVVQDTIDFAIGQIDELVSAEFRLNVTNWFPINVYTQVYFTDDNYNVVDSLLANSQNRLIEAATLQSDGHTTIPTTRMSDEPFSGVRLQHLMDAKKVIVKGIVQTFDAPNTMINLYDDYKIDFKLGVKTKLRIDLQ